MTEVRAIAEMDPSDALIVLAFPSTGAASPIAGQYLIQDLNMPLVGEVFVPSLQNMVYIQKGFPTTPVRIYGGDVACEIGGPCRRTYVIITEIQLPPPLAQEIGEVILEWAKSARLILSLDAIAREARDDSPDVFAVTTDEVAAERIALSNAPSLPAAIMTGMSAVVLGGARTKSMPAGALVVEALGEHPDGRAAAALVSAMDPLIPQIKIDAEPLLRDAMALEKQIDAAMREAAGGANPQRFI